MVRSRRWIWILFFGIAASIVGFFLLYPYFNPAPQSKPEPLPEKPYEYYIIHDEATGEILMYVTTVQVNVGDELITEKNEKYVVVEVVENKAYARFSQKEDVKKYLDQPNR
ncbi:hypothetical protein [Acetonema longum]|uniref:Uncharacterized protein n=1 Tax=Acetonema longum DSM 6540 TaxID=1009370 RepID=F7NJW2_9FIRM|nr:hypothetical protein [Acetonema longum]EGO63694.1 hypothetical protein ALO_11859 [Acetonema longum DSM 6540]